MSNSDPQQPSGQLSSPSASKSSNIVGGGKDQNYRFTVLTPGLIRIEYAPDNTFEDRPSSFAVHRDALPVPSFDLQETSGSLEITTSNLKLTYNKQGFTPEGLYATSQGATWRWSDANVGNLGGTIRTLDMMDGQNGMWSNPPVHVPLQDGVLGTQPFTYLDDSKSMIFDPDTNFIASRRPGDTRVDGYLFAYSRSYREAIKVFYALSGSVPLLPRWSFGNWWSRYYEYSEETYLDLMDKFEESKIPLSVAVIDMDWHLVREQQVIDAGASGWTGYTWSRRLFPDPPRFLSNLHSRGLKTTLNDHPADGIARYEDKYKEVAAFLGFDTSKGAPVPFDCTSKGYLKAYFDIVLAGLEAEGVDFWWIDWQQGTTSRLPNVDPLWVLNHYHFEHQKHRAGIKHPVIFSRFGGPGSHRYPIGFSGDTFTTWASLDFQPRFTATASNIGYGWWSHDIGGHQFGVRDDTLTIRWVQLGVLSPMMRLHSTKNRWVTKEPWNLPPTTTAIMTSWMQFRHRLIPYLYTMNVRASRDFEPLVQPLYWSYPDADQAYKYLNQFHFGSQMLVVPITSPQQPGGADLGRVDAWLPAGKWVDFFSGAVYRGNRELSLSRPLDRCPVFMKEGSIVVLDAAAIPKNGGGNPSGFEIILVVGADASFEILEDPADSEIKSNQATHITSAGSGDFDIFPITFTQSTGKLVIGPFKPSSSSSSVTDSTTRNWNLRLPALSTSATIEVDVEGSDAVTLLCASPSQDTVSGSIILPIGDVPVSQKITISFGANPQLRKNDPPALIESVVRNAQILYSQKDQIWDAITKDESVAFKVNRIQSLDIDEALKRFALECLLADEE